MASEDQEFPTIRRRRARSGRVSYGDPVTLYDSRRRQIQIIPYFIPRSHGTECAFKAVERDKKAGVERKLVYLPADGAKLLCGVLQQHLAVADEGEDGSYIALKVSNCDPSQAASILRQLLGRKDIAPYLTKVEFAEEFVSVFRGAMRLRDMQSAVEELRCHLDGGEHEESVYQGWCQRHSWAFGIGYAVPDEVRSISTGDKLDILLPNLCGFRDLVELKRPDMAVIQYDDSHRNYYFSSEVTKAIGQCHRYLDILHEYAAKGLLDHPEIVAYHPKAKVVIGRSTGWDASQIKALHGLNYRLSDITVMTYDELLAQGKRLVEVLLAEEDTGEQQAEQGTEPGDDGDIPF